MVAAASADTIRATLLAASAAVTPGAAELPATGRAMERLLAELVDKLRKAYGERLFSVVLYGSAAVPGSKDQLSDFNVLCVLREISDVELSASEPIFRWWREMQNPSPLLLTPEEMRSSADCFPIEFHDIREQHTILHGEDVVAELAIDDRFYRAMVEHELRAKMLRLRQKAAGILSDKELLLRLMADSVSTFCVLFRHVLRLRGAAPKFEKHEVVSAAEAELGISPQPFLRLLDLREGKLKPKDVDALPLFRQYMAQIQTAISAVDRSL
jgi:hypothetical protein